MNTLEELLDIIPMDIFMMAIAEAGLVWKSNCDRWYEMDNADDLDVIEMIMFMEKQLGIDINDTVGDKFLNGSPSEIYTYIMVKNRESKLNKLDI